MPKVNLASEHKWQIEFYFKIYRASLAQQEELADKAFRDWSKRLELEAQQYDGQEREAFYDFHSEEYTNRKYSRTILLNTFFVGAYALYEHHKDRIRSRYSISKERFTGSQLEESPEWKEVERYRRIRNSIMHDGWVIPQCEEALCYADEKGIIADFSARRYGLTRTFCDEALDNFEHFLLSAVAEFA